MYRGKVYVAMVVAVAAALVLASGAAAKVRFPRLDPSFGSGGYVSVPGQLAASPGETTRREGLAAAPGGAVYLTETGLVGGKCGFDKCLYRGFLARVNSDGSAATTFGGSGRVDVGGAIESLSPPLSDPEGRALVASQEGSSVTVHRYLADGSADTGFGNGGVTSFDCGCGTTGGRRIKLAVDGQGRIVVSLNTVSSTGKPAAETLARLLANGRLDAGFGGAGVLQLGAQPEPRGIAFGSNDAIYTWGYGYGASPYLSRVSAKGRIDTTFNARADRTLANVGARRVMSYGQALLVVRPHGLLDLYGGDALLRLRSDGAAEGKFGDGGVRLLGWTVLAATLAGHGKVLGLGESSEGVSLIRLLPNGKADRSFGTEGQRQVDGVSEEEGLGLARLNGRRALVLDLGYSFCRSICSNQSSTLVRYRIGPKN